MADKTASNDPNDEIEQSDTDLIEATISAITSTLPIGLNPTQSARATGRMIRGVIRQPQALLKRTVELGTEQVRIAAGISDVEPDPGDRRFSHDAWSENPIYKRVGQSYIAWNRAIHGLLDDLDLDEKSKLRGEFVTNLFTETVSPTNTLIGNPAALERARETRGRSLVSGARNAIGDLRRNGGMPSMVDSEPFVPGESVAATPGEVVFRNAVLELIQYTPSTAKVYKRPMVVVPPQINKFYILDLAPGRSLMEHLVAEGHQTFCISWYNPSPKQRDWDLDTYIAAIIEAIDAARAITNSDDVNVLGVCAGGITTASMLGYFAATGDTRVHSVSFLVTILDWDVPSTVGTFISGPMIAAATQRSKRTGILSGDDLNKLFSWLRPNDLVWNYWVNNYLLGRKPPAFDVLAWNGDSTNLPAALHGDFMHMAEDNALTKPRHVEVFDTPVDLGDITMDAFVVGAVTDHITPWQACYQTTQLLGGESEFVLSSQGHIQALVNPVGNPKGAYRTNPNNPPTAEAWKEGSEKHEGSWWSYWGEWLSTRGGTKVNAKKKLGNDEFHPLGEAPGTYVFG